MNQINWHRVALACLGAVLAAFAVMVALSTPFP